MYITCEQCSTIYRLDETLLKPSGSKVRCSQCRYVFHAEPPEAELVEVDQPEAEIESVAPYQDTFDQELEGIDVAELDSILEQGRTEHAGAALISQIDGDEDDEPVEFNEADLDMDFEAAFDQEEDTPAADVPVGSSDQVLEAPLEDLSGEIDLDMDFELNDGDEVFTQSLISEDDDLDADLDMDFNLDGAFEDSADIEASDDDGIAEEIDEDEDLMLNEDVELALDDFEDVLGGAMGTEAQDMPEVETSEEEIQLDIDLDGETSQELDGIDDGGEFQDSEAGEVASEADDDDLDLLLDDAEEIIEDDISEPDLGLADNVAATTPKAEGDDLDLSGFDELLDEEDEEARVDVSEPEDVELSLDDDFTMDAEEELVSDETLKESDATLTTSSEDEADDLDLGGLDDLLGVDEELDGVAVSKGQEVNLDEDLELSLDNEAVLDDIVDESAEATLSDDAQGDDLDLGNLDDLLEDDEEPVEAAAQEDEELSLDEDLDLSMDEDTVLSDASDESEPLALFDDAPDDDIDLAGLDDLLDEDEGPAEADVPASEELSLDDDLELSLDEEPEAASISEPEAAADQNDRDEFDLSDFEDLLVGEAIGEEDISQAGVDEGLSLVSESETDTITDGTEASDDFDMSEFDDLLDDEPITQEAQDDDFELKLDDDAELKLDDDVEFKLDDDIDLRLDDESGFELDSDSSGELVTPEEDADDFDLSGLDDVLLDDDESETPKASDDDMTLSLADDDDMELSLDEDAADATEAIDDDIDIGELEDLEFELDAEFEDKPISKDTDDLSEVEPQAAASLKDSLEEDLADEALDLSDIEQMLEDDTIVPESSATTQGLMMDSDSEDGGELEDDLGDGLGLDEDEIDLSEIEEAIDSLDEDQGAPFVDDGQEQELELELDLEPEESKNADASDDFELELEMEDSSALATAGEEKEDSDALDLSDFDLSMEDEKPVVETETIDGGDIQLEFQIEEQGLELENEDALAAAATAGSAATTSGFMQMQEEEDFSVEETIATEPIQAAPAPGIASQPPKKKGTSKVLLLLIFLLVLLAAVGYFGYDYVVKNNIQIPYVSDFINPEAKDPNGVQQLATLEINSKFIENEVEGRLFVITGKVRNGYSISHKMIRLRGKLYTKGKVLAKTEQSFAGLVMADQELSSKPMAEIKKGLSSAIGQDAAITVAAGNSAPFMVVFSQLPEDLDEFVIELVSSAKAQ